jgi:4-amino-4-deoxy-L-arabinose transferase-like glycosyltransferase
MDVTAVADDQEAPARSPWLWAFVAVVVAGLAVRAVGITAPPFGFHATRQLYGMEMARSFWVHLGGSVPTGWRPAVLDSQPSVIEPPVVPALAAALYRITGGEHVALVRLLLAMCWVGAAAAVWGAAARLSGRRAAIAATAVWCVAPYGVAASRSFQPDVLMVSLIAASVWATVRDDDTRTGRSRAMAVGFAAAAVFVKLVAAFYVLPLLAVYALMRRRRGERSWRRPVLDLAGALGPAVLFLVVGMATGLLAGQEESRIFPQLLVRAGFWSDWAANAARAGGALLVVLAVAGAVWARGRAGATVGALFAGYVAFGLAFTYHYRTHDYYHLPLVLVVSLGVGLFADRLFERLRSDGASTLVGTLAVAAVVVVGLATTGSGYPYVESSHPPGWDARIARAEQIGEALDHSTDVIVSGPAYGQIEQFYGGIAGGAWPTSGDIGLEALSGRPVLSFEERVAEIEVGLGRPMRWFVIADRQQYDDEPDLAGYLDSHFAVGARGDGWWAYRLDQPAPG